MDTAKMAFSGRFGSANRNASMAPWFNSWPTCSSVDEKRKKKRRKTRRKKKETSCYCKANE